MTLTRFATHQSRAVYLVTALLAAAGLVSAFSLPSSIYPPLEFPRIVAVAHAGTTPAQSMMLTVTRPIEQAIMEVPGIRRVRSRTFRGSTEIQAQFDPGTDMVVALQQAQDRVAEIRNSLPQELDLNIDRVTPAAFPIFSLNLTGGLSSADLHEYGFYVVRPALARVDGVGRVAVQASDTREIEVIVDPTRLTASGVTVDDVAAALKGQNLLAPVGHYPENGIQHLVLASGLWTSANQIGDTPVIVKNGSTVRVSDLATVTPGSPDRLSLIAGKGGTAVAITVSQQIDANVLAVRKGLIDEISQLETALPAGLRIERTYDLAAFVEAAIANVRDAIIIGGILAVLVLLAFLRNIRLTIIAASTLPLTVVSTFFFMWLFNESINLMSMGGIAVAIGLVIDDAVVVVENIHRRIAAGGGPNDVERATQELIAPVVSSTLTTVVVFAPLGFLSGVVGDFFKALSITLTVAVLISLVLALTLIPILARRSFRRGAHRHHEAGAGEGEHVHAHGAHHVHEETGEAGTGIHGRDRTGLIERWYVGSLPGFMRRPWLVALATIALAGAAYACFERMGTGFFPAADEGGFVLDYWTPPGMALEDTDQRMKKVEAVLTATPEVATFVRRTGSEMGLYATQQNRGDILIRLTPRAVRRRSADEVIDDVRGRVTKAVPDTTIEFVQLLQDMLGDLEGAPTPIEVKVFGDDQDKLETLSEEIRDKLGRIRGVVDIVGLRRGGPEVTWQVDPIIAGRLGLTTQQVSDQLSNAWLGETATNLRLLDRTIPVRVRYPDAVRFNGARLGDTTIRGATGTLVPASALVRISQAGGQAELMRENLRQMALVTARLENRDLGSAVDDVQRMLAAIHLPVGYTYEVGGQYESQREAFSEMLLVAGVAAALVFVILVVHFRSFTQATLILAAAPLSLGGALALLLITGTDLNVSSAMGLILLVGLVVKNGIVLLDFADRRIGEGHPVHEAVLMAARVRLRPILMTTLCTLFGLLPLALGIGAGAELQKPLALAVIGGLSLSTLVTLYLVPAGFVALGGKTDESLGLGHEEGLKA
jgi:multidrug efflux pump subunit AcrB